VNRITFAGTQATTGQYCWGYDFSNSYDAWGNLQSQPGASGYSCSQYLPPAMTANGDNHLSGFTYDSSGNTQSDGVNSYNWNAESQLTSAGGVNYLYDGDGRRVAKVGSKLYWYGSGGEILAETDASGNTLNEYIFFGGKRVALLPNGGSAQYYVEDLLGSSRVITTNAGVVCYDADFYPYGGESAYTNTCPQNYKFEGKERDAETLNDDFGARYYSWRFGRWLSADWSSVPVPVPYANLTNPQTLNLYAMVADDPESFADLDGHGPGDDNISRLKPGQCNAVACRVMPPDPMYGPPADQTGENQPVNSVKDIPYIGKALSWLVDGDKIARASQDFTEAETMQGKIGEGAALVLLVGINVVPGAGKAGKAAVKAEEVFVYRIVENGKTVYVGITKDLIRRAQEHGVKELERIIGGLTREQARGVEQALLNGARREGIILRNKINSIAAKSELYKSAVSYGETVLSDLGFKF
jgi:RHS repeat-associated protein